DIMMPDMDGYQTCQLLKSNPQLKNIPVIFVTALSEIDAEIKGFTLGAADFLTKPFNIEIARLRIRNLLERERMRRELQYKEAAQRLAASVFAHSHDGILIADAQNRIIDVNSSFTRITGYELDEVKGKNPSVLKSGRQPLKFYKDLWESLLKKDHWSGELWNRNKSGEIYAALTSISVVRDGQGKIHHFIGLFSDITSLKNHQKDLERIAHFDPLTGVPNRVLLEDRLNQALVHTRRSGNILAVCYLDLDGFKPVNDQHGHGVGDQLLIEVSQRIKGCLRAGDTVARLGGDEFMLLLLDLNGAEECKLILERTLSKLAEPVSIDKHCLNVSASLGFTLYPADSSDADTLIRHADQAMYVAKMRGKNRFHLFDRQQDQLAIARSETLARIEAGLIKDEFVLYFQPKVNMRLGRILGAEALIRWQHPQRGLLPPSAFLGEIAGTDLEIAVGKWVLGAALKHLENWRKMGLNITVSINVSPDHLLHPNFTGMLKEHLARHIQLPARALELEILETAALEDIGKVSKVMKECMELGIGFALDDFGTGYSSLTYLKALSAQTLKIDKSFVMDMLQDNENLAIVEGIINLSNTFGRQVIAEGVETVEHGLKLLQLGCENAQGFAIARPMPAENLPGWINSWTTDPAWLNPDI
ncbi:MAG: two-component system response regulator, partial [Methylomonas sp.]